MSGRKGRTNKFDILGRRGHKSQAVLGVLGRACFNECVNPRGDRDDGVSGIYAHAVDHAMRGVIGVAATSHGLGGDRVQDITRTKLVGDKFAQVEYLVVSEVLVHGNHFTPLVGECKARVWVAMTRNE